MQELIVEEHKNWLQLYVDAVTEKDPYKRLALVRKLREVPRHDESDETPERPRLQLIRKPAPSSPASEAAAPTVTASEPARMHLVRRSKPKARSKANRRSPRLRRA